MESHEQDNLYKPCRECDIGEYIETSIQDDWDKNLHCCNCGHCIKRYELSAD